MKIRKVWAGPPTWVVAIEAEIKAGKRTATTGARRRRVHKKHRMDMSRRAGLGISDTEGRTHLDGLTYGSINREQSSGLFHRHTAINPLSRRQGSIYVSILTNLRSSKRYNPGD